MHVLTLLIATLVATVPPGAPPKPATPSGPPPAWVESGTRSTWLAYSGYCWRTTCADYLPPASRPDLPALVATRGTRVAIHLAFRPSSASVTVLGATPLTTKLAVDRVLTWRPTRGGVFTVNLKTAAGSASYAGRLRLR